MNIDNKLKRIIKLAIFTLIYSYGIFWLDDDLFFLLTVVSLGGIVFIIPILFLVVFIRSIIYIIKKKDILGLIPIGILIFTIVLFEFFFPENIQRDMNYVSYQNLSEAPYVYVPELE